MVYCLQEVFNMANELRTTLRIPDELKQKLADEAKKQNRSVHNLIITILRDYFASK